VSVLSVNKLNNPILLRNKHCHGTKQHHVLPIRKSDKTIYLASGQTMFVFNATTGNPILCLTWHPQRTMAVQEDVLTQLRLKTVEFKLLSDGWLSRCET